MGKPSFVFSPQRGVRSGGEKVAIGAERGRKQANGQLTPAGAEKERCLAVFSGPVPWTNLFWE